VNYIRCNFEFVTLDSELMSLAALQSDGHTLSEVFVTMATRLGGEKADSLSHLSVALQTIAATWRDRSLSWTVRQAVVGKLLENLIKGKSRDQVNAIVSRFETLGRTIHDPEFQNYLVAWLRGHFI
jgi:hypothetical protein